MFIAAARKKGQTLPKLADLLINKLFDVLDEGQSFSARVFSPFGTKIRKCAAMPSQIRKKLNPPMNNEFITVGNIANDLLET